MGETKQAHTPGAIRAAKLIDAKVLRFETAEIERHPVEWLAEIIDRRTGAPDMLEALQAVFNDMRNGMASPSLRTMEKVYSAIQQACEHDWRGVDWGRMCFKCGKEDRQI